MVAKLASVSAEQPEKGGVVLQAVILRQVAERETVGHQQGAAGGGLHRLLIPLVQPGELLAVGLGVFPIGLGVFRVDVPQHAGDGLYRLGRVSQREPHVLVVFGLMSVFVQAVAVVLFLFRLHALHQLLLPGLNAGEQGKGAHVGVVHGLRASSTHWSDSPPT